MAAQISSPLPPTITVLGGPTPNTLWAVNLYGSGGVLYSTENVPSDSAFSYYTNALLQYNSLISKSAIAPSPSASTAQIPAKSNTTPPITPSPTVFSASTPLTPPSSRSSGSITSSRQSGTSTAQSTSPAVTHSPSGHRLSNGAVAGIVVGVAVGLAFLTFLLTFLFMRRRGVSSGKRHHGGSNKRGIPASGSVGQQARGSEPKKPLFTETSSGSDSLDNFLPQSADDKTVQNNVTTTLDQIELHVENFYQNTPAPGAGSADAELATFNSPYLPNPLATLLPQTSNKVLLIKHALAHFVSSCISATAGPDWSLLPDDFVLLPSTIRSATSSRSMRPGEYSESSKESVLFIRTLILRKVSAGPCLDGECFRPTSDQTLLKTVPTWLNATTRSTKWCRLSQERLHHGKIPNTRMKIACAVFRQFSKTLQA